MTNKEIAKAFDDLANVMELNEENQFKIRSYRNAYLTLRKLDSPLSQMTKAEIDTIPGVGAAIGGKIRELVEKGRMEAMEQYRATMPAGVLDMLQVNGFDPKKVRIVWKEMGVETVGELWYACNENRLVDFKGFGQKTQEDLKNKLEYYLKSRDKLHLDAAEQEADFVANWLGGRLQDAKIMAVGELRRRCAVISKLEILVATTSDFSGIYEAEKFIFVKEENNATVVRLENGNKVYLYCCLPEDFGSKMFQYTGNAAFIEAFVQANPGVNFKNLPTEKAIFEKAGLPEIAPELRENAETIELAKNNNLPQLIENEDIKGVLHVHTKYSDGIHTLRDMCEYARSLGYAYIGITDHSQSAFYANGLKFEKLMEQWEEIDKLNAELAPFRILKGIESDILNDGSLDYSEEILAQFDFVIASVHSNLKMPMEKATARILKAIENPHTTILGHPTGRLLLAREGYPLDWSAILDACAKHNVAIEVNANPHRLDLDWTLIPEALKRGIKIAINPDAHSKDGIHHIRYGVMVARKGGLEREGLFSLR